MDEIILLAASPAEPAAPRTIAQSLSAGSRGRSVAGIRQQAAGNRLRGNRRRAFVRKNAQEKSAAPATWTGAAPVMR